MITTNKYKVWYRGNLPISECGGLLVFAETPDKAIEKAKQELRGLRVIRVDQLSIVDLEPVKIKKQNE